MKTILKYILKVGSVIMKIFLFLLVILILAPIGFFAWRVSQPMNMPEYDGRTFYELLSERRQAYTDLAQTYQASHPNTEVNNGMCFQNEVFMAAVYTLPWAGFCTISNLISPLQVFVGPRARQAGCDADEDATWLNLFSSWWGNFEKMQYPMFDHRTVGPVIYCRIPAP
jgi:hypothetical protein